MAIRCLTSSRFSMNAEILSWVGQTTPTSGDVSQGTWTTYQDPITREILNKWSPTYEVVSQTVTGPVKTVPCLARGVVSGGTRVSGTSENFGDDYENIEYVRLWVPASVRISKRDRVTNIRSKKGGQVLWLDEEYAAGTRPTVFNVMGVTPLFDPFNNHTQSYVTLEKSDA